ncbi:MAG: hypothetical protein IRZ13_18090 [Acetobacteraceae bacterium]|nr:hypothetical protein [Acetobacteraceae bacterium]
MTLRSSKALVLCLIAGLGLGGCVYDPVVAPPPVYAAPPRPVVVAPPPPPPPVVVRPAGRRVWVPGHYNWRGRWVPGHWEWR